MAIIKELKNFQHGAMNQDDAPEIIGQSDFVSAWNVRTAGTSEGEDGYVTNIESNFLVQAFRNGGLNKGNGAQRFETLRIAIAFIWNSAGFHQIAEFNFDTGVQTIVFTNKTDSGGVDILSLDPQHYVTDIKLIADTFLTFRSDVIPPAYINYTRLKSGFYGVLTANDFSLAKPQNLIPISFPKNSIGNFIYGNDLSRSTNLLSQKLFQFISQFQFIDYELSAWSMMSKRLTPTSESTPTVGTNVTNNNNIVVIVDIGDNRVDTLIVGARYSMLDWFQIKSIKRADILALTATSVNILNQVYESYDPATNLYSFVFYNDGLYQPISVLETDLAYDAVPNYAGAMEVPNGNLSVWGDITQGYTRPTTAVTLNASAYDPGIAVTLPVYDYLRVVVINSSGPGSGLGNHKRKMEAHFLGLPKTGDSITMTWVNAQDATQTFSLSHIVLAAEETAGILATMMHYSAEIANLFNNYPFGGASNAYTYTVPDYSTVIYMEGPAYYDLTYCRITLANAGAGVSKSIHGVKSNSSYQLALSYRDDKGRFFPLRTDNSFVLKTQSYAQIKGLTQAISWTINTQLAPAGAFDYQWVLTENNTHQSNLFINGCLVHYINIWNAATNTPTIATGSGTVGDSYSIGVPGSQNLGNGVVSFQSGDFIVYNGVSWDVVSRTLGDLSDTSNYLVFKINPLSAFNKKNTTSILKYGFVPGDRVTLCYFTSSGSNIFFNQPVIDVEVVGFDVTSYLLKVRKSSVLVSALPHVSYNGVNIDGNDILMEIYTPLKRVTTSNGVTSNNTQLYFEIGERYPIINGNHSVLNGQITDGGIYYKTREVISSINPSTLLELVVEDFNFSDFYISNYTSYGRPRSYDDVLETTRKKAVIVYSDEYVLGSKINGLTRFYPERVYGQADGQVSANYGAINKLYQRNNDLVCIQELKEGYIPVFQSILTDQAEQKQYAISDKIFGNIRYNTSGNIGMGNCKESFAAYGNNLYYVDPHRSEPVRSGLDGVKPITGKMTKFFKSVLQLAFAQGKKIIGYYDEFNNEYIISIETDGDIVTQFSFTPDSWQTIELYTIAVADIVSVNTPSMGTVSGVDGLGNVVYQSPTSGSANFTFTFNVGVVPITKRACIAIGAGITAVNPFYFIPQTNQLISTYILSNTILVTGNTVPVAISITGGQYSINGGTFTSAAGVVNPLDTVQVEVMSSASVNTATSATLTISGTSAAFSVTTAVSALVVGVLIVDIFTNTTLNVSAFCDTPAAVDFYRQLVYTGSNFYPSSSVPAANNWALASDINPPDPTRRFEFNISKLVNAYPLQDTFVLKIKGRDVGAGTIAGAYIMKSSSVSLMSMSGSPGTYIPSASGANIGVVSYSGKAIGAGADGTYGYGVGADVLVFTYTASTNTLTLA